MPRPPANKKQSKTTAKKVFKNKQPRKAAKFAHTTPLQLEGMVLWIEVSSNRPIYLGESTAGKSMAHGSGITKLAGFASMAQYVHEYAMQYGGDDPRHSVVWDRTTCQSRWASQFKRYKNTRERKNSNTGFGITEEMLANGITVDDMIEKACPFYTRMDAMFAEQANVNPESECHVPDLSDDDRAVKVTVEKPYSMLELRISMSVMIVKTKPTRAETFNMTKVNPTRKIDHQAGCPMLICLQIQQVYQTDNRFNSFSAVKTSPA
ncbi:hypothetical protein PPTG_10129 [Phytophthora nicotianae INRA-310]|uniref:Uncharacterized protein n=1 Tax=Phytophthora nicotianae (strain INRA-310) TaxID=761204 RepID=W2QDD1_PHYN3|nr:hypothetical protein PPTG_10129 [Phytophthora nicotianae INRA-310]ETN11177.1 hypothetical protein PPTG_10129 [Phytophthora nicotianae INRA-310]